MSLFIIVCIYIYFKRFLRLIRPSIYSNQFVFPGTVVAPLKLRCDKIEARFLYFDPDVITKTFSNVVKSLVPLSFSKYTEITLAPMEGRGALILRRFTPTLSILPRIVHTQIY